ncbi:MAG: 3-oxoacyl-[acyl-carrier-protein] reductase [Omnitrophica bacterium RIFCSPLOWO2_01_FULL_45_10]|nr:MAG: 3-oxoacyl-[acyl-carrier-protein] reductase [Omnitrophica bacterium RIFCSPLOWO2_01_FULL_45_10]
MLLKDKVALVTGGARGIGREIALLFAKEGSNIAICDVNPDSLAAAQSDIGRAGRDVLTGVVDVTKQEGVESFVQKTLDKFKKIDILVNNAGIARDALLVRMSESDWDMVLDVNLKGAFHCTKAVSKAMMKERRGSIVNIASIIGIMGNPGQANYAASKGGLIAFTKTVAKEFASRNIRANAIAPGFIQTDMTAKLSDGTKIEMLKHVPLGKLGTVQDVANLALFLASEDSAYITGQVIQVDGGMVM